MFPEARWAANAAQMQLHHQRFEPAGKQEQRVDVTTSGCFPLTD